MSDEIDTGLAPLPFWTPGRKGFLAGVIFGALIVVVVLYVLAP